MANGEVSVLTITFFGIILGGIYLWDEKEGKNLDCLEPYALKICQERNLYYYSHSTFATSCKQDIRDIDSLRFKFNITERSSCGIGGF